MLSGAGMSKKQISSLIFSLLVINAHTVTPIDQQNKMNNLAVDQLQNYFIANYNQFGGNMKKAYERYKELIQTDAPSYSYKGYIHLLFETGNYAHVLQLIPKVDVLFKDTQDVQIIFAKVLEQAGKTHEADAKFIELNDKFKTNQELAFQAANSYLRRKEPENAIKVIDSLLNNSTRRPNNYIFYFMKSQIYTQLNKKDDALKNIQKSLELHPRFDKGWLLYALLHEQAGELQSAIKGYSTFLELTGANKEVEEHLMQLLFKQKIEQQSQNKNLIHKKKSIDVALHFFEEKKYNDALVEIDKYLTQKPQDNEGKVLKIQILTALNQIDTIASLLEEWMIQEPEKQLWFSTLHLLTKTDMSYEKAIAVLHTVEKAQPKRKLPVLYLTDLYLRTPEKEKAKQYLKKSLDITSDNNVKGKILFQIGLLEYESGNHEKLSDILLEAKRLNPTYAPTSNLLAYYYASTEKNIDEAQKILAPIIKKYPNNAHYLDTQAFIYLKQKKHAQALPLLQKLAQKAPKDYTILVHLSQAQHLAGKSNLAVSTIENAEKYAHTTQEKQECQALLNQWKTQKT